MRAWAMAGFLAAATLAGAAWADEAGIRLAPGPGLAAVEQSCAACHSLDYIEMNAAILGREGWAAVVAKMVDRFGAPVAEDDRAAIIDYLTASYGKP